MALLVAQNDHMIIFFLTRVRLGNKVINIEKKKEVNDLKRVFLDF